LSHSSVSSLLRALLSVCWVLVMLLLSLYPLKLAFFPYTVPKDSILRFE